MHVEPTNVKSLRHGFTIVEVLCALAIFTLAAVVLGGAYVNVLNSYFVMSRTVRSEDDLKFARSALLAESDLKKAEEGADFTTTEGRRVRWSATIEPTSVADLFTVIFRCEIGGLGVEAATTVEQSFRVLRPTWSEAGEHDKLRAEAQKRILELQEKKL